MVSAIFTILMLGYYFFLLRRRRAQTYAFAFVLWAIYFAMGLIGIVGEVTNSISLVFPINIEAPLALFVVLAAFISAFLRFDERQLPSLKFAWQSQIENGLVAIQVYSILFFIPFALDSLVGDPNLNRLLLIEKSNVLSSYGLLNTFATAGAQLFVPSMVLAFLRLSPTKVQGRNLPRAVILLLCSLSYVIYVLAYVGRDGVVYWIMMAGLFTTLFWKNLVKPVNLLFVRLIIVLGIIIILPLIYITISRFKDFEDGRSYGLLHYFGVQIVNFSDYCSMDRPVTLGALCFPFIFDNVHPLIYDNYKFWDESRQILVWDSLSKGKEPWMFGTFLSDFTLDFTLGGALVISILLSALCAITCSQRFVKSPSTIPRFLLIVLLFQIPYWGIFYFRFAGVNSYLLNNVALIFVIYFLQCYSGTKKSLRFGPPDRRPR